MEQLEKYIKVKELSKGSYGIAYLVKRSIKEDHVVVKSIILDGLSDNEKKDTFKEAKILMSLKHHNIIKFIEVFKQSKPKSTLNIVMEYANGGDLFSKIREQQLKNKLFSETQILDWLTQICLGLKYIHNNKILHRDIKSKNIFLTKNGLVKIGDFGISKCLSSSVEVAKTFIGTPYYLSPEIVSNQPYSYKSDVWSLGVLLYELCTLKLPFDGVSLNKLSANILNGIYEPVNKIYSIELRDLVKELLNPSVNKRPFVEEILKKPLIRKRINSFLSEIEMSKDIVDNLLLKEKNKQLIITNKINNDKEKQLGNEEFKKLSLKEFILSKQVIIPSVKNENKKNIINDTPPIIYKKKTNDIKEEGVCIETPKKNNNEDLIKENSKEIKSQENKDFKNTMKMIKELINIDKDEVYLTNNSSSSSIDDVTVKETDNTNDNNYVAHVDEPNTIQSNNQAEDYYINLIGKRLYPIVKEIIHKNVSLFILYLNINNFHRLLITITIMKMI